MSKEQGIPISFVKKFTPLSVGDVLSCEDGGYSFTLNNKAHAAIYNKDDELSDKEFKLLSFASRPNIGTQPVRDDIEVTCVGNNGTEFTDRAQKIPWLSTPEKSSNGAYYALMKWKPNRAAMLAKFKSEQGANMNTFTLENTKDATHLRWSKFHSMFHFFLNGGFTFWQDGDRIGDSDVEDCDSEETTQLSRPVGERLEDHADENGNITYALTYKLDTLTKTATHYNEGVGFHRLTNAGPHGWAMGLEGDNWEYTDVTNKELETSDKFYALDKFANPENFGAIPGKPVFTQEAADAGELPPVGAKVLYNVCNLGAATSSGNDKYHGEEAHVVAHFRGLAVLVGDNTRFTTACNNMWVKPMDNRADEEKAIDDILDLKMNGECPGISIVNAVKAGKIHGVKWVGK